MNELFVVKVRRSGGVAGIPRTGYLEFDAQSPPPEDLPWARLAFGALEQLRGLQEPRLPEAPGTPLARDAFIWLFSFNGEEHRVPDHQLTGPARELAKHLTSAPRRRGSEGAGSGNK